MASRMAAKIPRKKKAADSRSVRDRGVDAALLLAAVMPWDSLTLSDIAQEAGVALCELRAAFDDKADILSAYGKRVDQAVLAASRAPDLSLPEKDRLFEILMERFDVIQNDRAAVVSILKSFVRDPKQAVISLPHLTRSMVWMMEGAGLSTEGIRGALTVLGLSAAYLNVLRVWIDDESADLSATMAALDKTLSRAEQIAGWLPL